MGEISRDPAEASASHSRNMKPVYMLLVFAAIGAIGYGIWGATRTVTKQEAQKEAVFNARKGPAQRMEEAAFTPRTRWVRSLPSGATVITYTPAPGPGQKITTATAATLWDIAQPARAATYDGSWVDVQSIPVVSVTGDKVFAIGQEQNKHVFVKIEEPTAPGAKGELELVVLAGQTVRVAGVLRRIPANSYAFFGLTEGQTDNLGSSVLYIDASLVEVLGG